VLPNREPVGSVLRAPKTAELIASYIRGQIVRGDLKTGDALPSETVLMEMFGVSRPTLREAFRILEAESLISVRRGARGGARWCRRTSPWQPGMSACCCR
jgi:DNA-binding FadR family transcriptional regulator